MSLKGSRAALVLLRAEDALFVPLTLAIRGQYNRLGSIDMIDDDAHTEWFMEALLEEVEEGNLTFDDDLDEPLASLEAFLQACERNMNDAGPEGRLRWDEQPIFFALVAEVVWQTIASATPASKATPTKLAKEFFGISPLGIPAKRAAQAPYADKLRELKAVTDFMVSTSAKWQPTEADGQHYADDLRQFLDEARQRFANTPLMQEALDAYEEEIADLLDDA